MVSLFFATLQVLLLCSFTHANPVNLQYCPVIQNAETGVPESSKIINMDDVPGKKLKLQFLYPNSNTFKTLQQNSAETTTPNEGETARSLETTTTANLKWNVYCQWEFKTSNDSQLLLLTFEKLSAPFSDNCVDAFVAMQKHNAFESRWCGNRKSGKSRRPMTLFSKGSAKVSAFHGANAEPFPSTGFSVIVEVMNGPPPEDRKDLLRVLFG